MESRYVAAVDIGSSHTTLAVGLIEGGSVQIVHYGRTPSQGVRKGAILNPTKTAEAVRTLLEETQKSLGIKITQVMAGLPRYYVKQYNRTACIDVTDGCINQEQVDSLRNIATDDCPIDDPGNETVYCAVNQSFSVEDYHQISAEDVVGIMGEKLEGNFKVFAGSLRAHTALTWVMNNVGLAIYHVFTPDTTAKAILTEDEMETGTALVEMGAEVTSVSIYKGGILRYYAAIPFGGSNVTNDLGRICGLSSKLSENIKLGFGGCLPEKLQSLGDKKLRIDYHENGTTKELNISYISEIITAREREIISAILYYIQQSGLCDEISSGVVITGGAANMLNISTLIRDMSGYSVRLGYPLNRFGWSGWSGATEMDATTAVGMVLSAVDMPHFNSGSDTPYSKEMDTPLPQEEDDDRETLVLTPPEPEKLPHKPRKPRKKATWINKMVEKGREIWDDNYNQTDDNE